MTNAISLTKGLGFLRVGVAVPPLRVANTDFNVAAINSMVKEASSQDIQALCFPEMAITGYTIGDLVHHQALLAKAREGLRAILQENSRRRMVLMVGMPLEVDGKVFNCAVILNSGSILGVVPKTYLPTYKEFYEGRWFAPSTEAHSDTIELLGQEVPFGTDILVRIKDVPSAVLGFEICEDLWIPCAPHEYAALAGATVLFNLSASDEVIGKADWRRMMVSSESGRCLAAYCYVSSDMGESSNDVVYGGQAIIAENGVVLGESSRLTRTPQLVVADIDVERLAHDHRVMTTFHEVPGEPMTFRVAEAVVEDHPAGKLRRSLDAHPFVPSDPARRAERCREIFSMQVAGVAKKLTASGSSKLVLGVSGGLDSTLSLLVACKTMDLLKLPRSNMHAFTLPGFGTTTRTKSNATRLCKALGVTLAQVDIKTSSRAHLRDLAHNGKADLVFENVQARYRTEFLFNKANQIGGIVLGTGDLTEVALGWCTFAGDHLSHYHVNASVPKTLVSYLVKWVADEELAETPARKILYDVLDTPISPELLPPVNGAIAQKSEEIIGPVELADFYLYPFVRLGTRPGKILYLANEVREAGLFDGKYTLDDLYKWLKGFIKRFFANQFKRTCFPEGPKIGSVSLSPRGDWRMPSDADAKVWLDDLEEMYAALMGSSKSRKA